VYRKTSSSLEEEYYVIYVENDSEEYIFEDANKYTHVTLEVRDYEEYSVSPLIYTYDLYSHDEALSLIGNDYLWINNEEYEKISAEIDEDRSTYVLYMSKS
jgi:translation elongation factor P/translation initiation factor 5A